MKADSRARHRCHERLERMVGADLEADDIRRAAIEELRRSIGFERWCWPLTDPDSALSMSGIGEVDFWPTLAHMVALEQHGDITSKSALVTGRRASIALSAATGGDLARSRRWRECLQPYGIGDQAMTVCRDRHGCWGSLELMREATDTPFSDEEIQWLDELAPTLGTLVRQSLLRNWRADTGQAGPRTPGTVILDEELRTVGWTSPLRAWLADLPSPALSEPSGMLPTAVYEIGARVLACGAATSLPNSVRIPAGNGRWVVMEGAPLEGTGSGRVAITVRAATSEEVFDVLCKAHALTPRERQLVARMLDGLATRELAEALGISPYTVQDHLKAIFDKAGVRSRRELVSHLAGFGASRAIGPVDACASVAFRVTVSK